MGFLGPAADPVDESFSHRDRSDGISVCGCQSGTPRPWARLRAPAGEQQRQRSELVATFNVYRTPGLVARPQSWRTIVG
jgi:hypothetical protein